jgi:hypothetical protein
MSDYNQAEQDDDGNVIPFRQTRASVIPAPLFMSPIEMGNKPPGSDPTTELRKGLDDFIHNRTPGIWSRYSDKIVPKGMKAVSATILQYGDGSPSSVEMRCEPIDKSNQPIIGKHAKKYRNLFRNDLDGCLVVGQDQMMKVGLFMPLNAPTLLRAYRANKAGSAKSIIWWAEGEKSRAALEELSKHPHAIKRAKELGASSIVVCGWICGVKGARGTNFELKPGETIDKWFTLKGVNDEAVDQSAFAGHMFFCDNDEAGVKETGILLDRFENDYFVPNEKGSSRVPG